MFNFPDTPTIGQQVAAANGIVYKYDGTKWASVAGGSAIATGAVPPSSPAMGQLWWDTIGGQLYIYYNDGNSSQWVAASAMNTGQSTPPIVAPPIAASWTLRNPAGGASITDAPNGVVFYGDSTVTPTQIIRGITLPAPTAPYTIDANLSTIIFTTGASFTQALFGLGWFDGTRSESTVMTYSPTSTPFLGSVGAQNVASFTSTGAAAGGVGGSGLFNASNFWMRIADDGTNASYALSLDGVFYVPIYSVAKASGYLGSSGYINPGIWLSTGLLGNPGNGRILVKSWWLH